MPHPKYNDFIIKIKRLISLGLGVAILDGGAMIAVQIVTFLLTYFYMLQPGDKANIMSLTVLLLGTLNLAVIIYRISWLIRGIKYSLSACYLYALRRWPLLILLYIIGATVLLALAQLIFKLFIINRHITIFLIYSLIPYGLLACIFVVDQRKNPFQAITAAYNLVRYKMSASLLIAVSAIYGFPCLISSIIANAKTLPYISLVTALWLLFCHFLTIILYIDSLDRSEKSPTKLNDKETKIIII